MGAAFDFRRWAFLLPLTAGVVWTATLLGLLLWWVIDDNYRPYRITDALITFISYVGAAHKALFVAGSALTFLFFTLTLIAERDLRHLRRIPGVLTRRFKYFNLDTIALLFGILGGLCLLLLSIFDAFTYSTAHWSFTVAFVLCIALNTVLSTQGVRRLEANHVGRNHLRQSAIIKIVIVSFALAGAIVFAVSLGICRRRTPGVAPTERCNIIRSVAGAAEWFIAFLFAGYLFSIVLDFWPARKTAGNQFDPALIEADKNNMLHFHKDGTPGAPADFIGTNTTNVNSVESFNQREMRQV